jgi:long-chain acyl-CoA synthetase
MTGTLPQVLAAHAAEHPGRVALRHKDLGRWKEYTWADYADHVARAGLALQALEVTAGDRVAIIGENRPEWIFADLGAQGVGAVVVGVYTTSPAAEVEYLLEHSGTSVVVVEDEEQLDKVLVVRHKLPALRHVVLIEERGAGGHLTDLLTSPSSRLTVRTWDDFMGLAAGQDPATFAAARDQVRPSDIAMLVYTSGTTGPPKGAMLTHANLASAGKAWGGIFDNRPDDEILSYLPLCHVLERLLSTVVAVTTGYTVNFGGGGEALVSDLREVQPTFFIGVPRVWEKMLATVEIRMADASWLKRAIYGSWLPVGRRIARKRLTTGRLTPGDRLLYAIGWLLLFRPLRERLGLARVRHAGSGAAPIAPQVLEFFWAIGVPIHEGYGQTEGSGMATFNPPGAVRLGTVGVPLPGCEVRIASDGEILIRSSGVFAGYYRNEEATRETVDADGWLHSGDVGEFDAEGYLRITDRKKDIMITAGGKNITPSWIENKLKVSPYVREAIVIGDRRKYVAALIGIELDTVRDWATRKQIAFTTYEDLTTKPEVRTLVQAWVDQVNADLAPVEQVKKFALLPKELDHEDGELTATQKVKRRAIAAMFGDLVEGLYR